MSAAPSPLVLVDGSSYLYRAFHALPALSASDGTPTGAILGVLNMLNKLLDEHSPEHVAVVMDARGPTFRDELFEQYKANRPPMPDELRAQVEPLIEAVRAQGIALLRVEGVEADDVIGTLVRQACERGMPVLVSTADKDMAQLVTDGVKLVNTMSGQVLDEAGVKDKFDVHPSQIIDWLALVGDSSDNIPGVPKVGPKTAAKWLGQYDSIDGIVEHADEIGGKVGESLREHLDQLALSRKLATIRTDVELDVTLDELCPGEQDVDALRKLYGRLELTSLLRRLPAPGTSDEPAATAEARELHFDTVLDDETLSAWIERIEAAELTALDTETTSLNYMRAELVGISLAVTPGEACYIPLAHRYPGAPDQLDRESVIARLKPWLENAQAAKVGHHLKYDAHVLAHYGIELKGQRYDTMLESYVLNSVATRHDMDSVAARYLGVQTISYESVAGKGAKQIGFDQVALEQAAPYAAEDADITLQLHQTLWPKLETEGRLAEVYRNIEQPLVPVLTRMEHTGVLVDRSLLKTQSHELALAMAKVEKLAYEAAGGQFNLSSPKQLQEILFERQGLPVRRKTPKGQPSTAEDVLAELADEFELPRLILEYRGLAKLKSTYTDKLPEMIDERSGRIHTSYHQAVAATGRLSSSDPNLQNIPIRTAEGRRIRQAFIAPEGTRLIAADYSQIELRIMAHLSADTALLEAFSKDRDIHQATAAEVFEVPLEAVTSDQRRSAKAINFGLIYGMSAFGLARQLGIGRSEAQSYVDTYFKRYPGVKRYMDDTRAQAREAGYVETVFGRRLYLPEINARDAQRRQYAERSAINAPMQGTAADIIKRAMILVDEWLQDSRNGARLIMQVHDELVLEAPSGSADAIAADLSGLMSGAAELSVPLKVDARHGDNWDEAH
ncbi:MAG: DNA polymerase I [Gammaproteobacteria bacterium]|nr:DNA polymerase I [Gammaproteobacteria bacterium]